MANERETVLIATGASEELARKVAALLGLPLVPVIKKTFADGETYHAFPEAISGKDLVIIGAT
ncbi:MAG: ribose-phosphate pyrophosphokinase-like domain-containing protein, partial [Desulfobulbaceae bacterium]|nr:ribose-phosphate pyrophosphokinase-like domain-containing protein [Desulfobulbaceae bacterium]